MKVAGLRDLRSHMSKYFAGEEPVVVTRRGKVSGVYVPLDEPELLPEDLRNELGKVLGRHLNHLLETKGATEDEILEDFDAYRRSRR